MNSRSSNYDDIINTEYPFELKHTRMRINDRAAQFSAFQALSGFEAEIQEAARSTYEQVELDESHKDVLNATFMCIREKVSELPLTKIVYFEPDAKKNGGKYITVLERVKRIDQYAQSIQTVSGLNIPIEDIYELELLGERKQPDYHESNCEEPRY